MINLELVSTHIPERLNTITAPSTAVLIPIISKAKGFEILFTLRSQGLSTYKHHAAFPGGRYDDGDKELVNTALRETEEEIGINRKHITIIGQLDDFLSGKGHLVTPFVGTIQNDTVLQRVRCSEEVERVFSVPISKLLNPLIERHPTRGKRLPMYIYPIDDIEIWGLTGTILTHFMDVVSNRVPCREICKVISG